MYTFENFYARVKADLESYVRTRIDAVERGAETHELAALLVHKYGEGLAKAVSLASTLADVPASSLSTEVNKHVLALNPYWHTYNALRLNARPATLVLHPAGPTIE